MMRYSWTKWTNRANDDRIEQELSDARPKAPGDGAGAAAGTGRASGGGVGAALQRREGRRLVLAVRQRDLLGQDGLDALAGGGEGAR